MMCYYLNVQFQGQRVNDQIDVPTALVPASKPLVTSGAGLFERGEGK